MRRWGSAAAALACLLNGAWLVCMIYLASLGETAAQVRAQPGIFHLSLGSCLVLTLLQIPILLALVAAAFELAPAASLIGGVVYVTYVSLNLIGYFSFGRLAPLVHTAATQRPAAIALLGPLIEIGGPTALTGMLPVLGYGVLGLAWCLLAPPLWRQGRSWRAAVILLLTSGVLSIAGAAGAFLAIPWLSTGSMLGGVYRCQPSLCWLWLSRPVRYRHSVQLLPHPSDLARDAGYGGGRAGARCCRASARQRPPPERLCPFSAQVDRKGDNSRVSCGVSPRRKPAFCLG